MWKTPSRLIPQGVVIDSMWETRWKRGTGDFQGKWKDS